jgi:hypothetical protein
MNGGSSLLARLTACVSSCKLYTLSMIVILWPALIYNSPVGEQLRDALDAHRAAVAGRTPHTRGGGGDAGSGEA